MSADRVIDALKKQFGENSIIKASQLPDWKVMPFYVPEIDESIGGGWIVGRMNMLVGEESSGKSTLACKMVANFQKIGVDCFYIDADKLFDPERASVLGVDVEKLIVISENLNTEYISKLVSEILLGYNREKDRRVHIVIDSLASLRSIKEFEILEEAKNVEDARKKGYGTATAKANNDALVLWNAEMSRDQTITLVQQYRQSLAMFGEDKVISGGQGQLYAPPTRLEVRRGKQIKEGKDPVGQVIGFTVKKSKSSVPKVTGEVDFYFDKGFDFNKSLINTAVELEVIERSGSTYSIPELDIRVVGLEKLQNTIRDKQDSNPEFFEQLTKLVYSKMNKSVWDGTPNLIKDETKTS